MLVDICTAFDSRYNHILSNRLHVRLAIGEVLFHEAILKSIVHKYSPGSLLA